MISNLRPHSLGVTLFAVGASLSAQFVPPPYCTGLKLKYASGGSLALIGSTGAAVANGIALDSTYISVYGPASFYLAANGATAVAGIILEMSSGASLFP